MSTATYVDPKRVQALINNAGVNGVNVKDLKNLVNSKKVEIDPSLFQNLIDKFPEQSIPKNGDAIYHGGFPIFNADGTFKTVKFLKHSKGKTTEIEKIETTAPCFTLRFRLLDNKVIIGWALPRQDSLSFLSDTFNRAAGRNYSHLQLLRNCNSLIEKQKPACIVDFMSIKNDLPTTIFANLKFYIDKFVRYVAKDVKSLEFYILTHKKMDDQSIQQQICCVKGYDIASLPIQYLPKRFYRNYTK